MKLKKYIIVVSYTCLARKQSISIIAMDNIKINAESAISIYIIQLDFGLLSPKNYTEKFKKATKIRKRNYLMVLLSNYEIKKKMSKKDNTYFALFSTILLAQHLFSNG